MTSTTPANDSGLHPDGSRFPVAKTETQWREMLGAQAYHVLREAGTEPPFVGEYTDTTRAGTYRCRACGAELFRSTTKFDSHCGWPSFYQPANTSSVKELADHSHGMIRTEVTCAKCDSHLGHVFPDGPPETGLRYCVNSASLDFEKQEEGDAE